ncbi:MAG: type II toxin-antitoxin system VapC family toxin [Patescibacteria group bacterium]
MKLTVDSSVFVAAFREEEPCSREALHFVSDIEKGLHTVVTPTTVILEVIAAIRRRTASCELARNVGEKLLTLPTISLIDITAFRMAQYLDIASESGLAGMDGIVVGVAREFDVPLLTLDQEIISRGRLLVRTLNIREL